jgi:NADH:ubiquinone oxidoreductase subunit 5 (subunit L)/multisubunit Na+/H+ antiporter MnhA subunit
MNRVGDMGLSIGFLALFTLFGSLDYSSIFSLAPFLNETSVTVIGLFLLIGAMAKSAQIPLHSWLPGSMEGPTPVSALIHAATLVTAGLYLLVRCSTILEYSPTALLVITLVGSTTAFVGALCGLVQNDIKRIIAFSTISQLGYYFTCYFYYYLNKNFYLKKTNIGLCHQLFIEIFRIKFKLIKVLYLIKTGLINPVRDFFFKSQS